MPGITVERADAVLREEEKRWVNVSSATDRYLAYTDAVEVTYAQARQTFLTPDIGAALHSDAYWNILSLGSTQAQNDGWTNDPDVMRNRVRAARPFNGVLSAEIDRQAKALEHLRAELEALKQLASRDGIPIVYDTNMLNHWQQPGGIRWQEVLKANGENASPVRLVIPLRVIDELDKQKYSQGDLGKRAAAAIRYLERVLKDGKPGEPVYLREKATLEVWVDTDDRGGDADLSILRCAADLDNLHGDTGARVLTDDCGMRLRANQMGLKVLRLPNDLRKPGTAIGDMLTQEKAEENRPAKSRE